MTGRPRASAPFTVSDDAVGHEDRHLRGACASSAAEPRRGSKKGLIGEAEALTAGGGHLVLALGNLPNTTKGEVMRLLNRCRQVALPWIGVVCCAMVAPAGASSVPSEAPGSQLDPLSCGFVPHIVERGDIQLPIDDWQEAEAIAAAWLDAVGDPTLQLGEMSQLGDTFLLTIVDRSDGKMLRHQIVIGVHDGRVAVL